MTDKEAAQAALWASCTLLECLAEAGDDVEAGFAAAEHILATQPIPLSVDAVGLSINNDIDIFLAHDIHNPRAQNILNRALKAVKGLNLAARKDLAAALKRGAKSSEAILSFVTKYKLQLAKLLTTTQLASVLEGAREVAAKVPPLGSVPTVGLPILEQERIAALASIPPTPPFTPPAPAAGSPEEVHFPIIDEAVKDLASRRVLTREEYDALDAAARTKAFTVANVQAEETLTKIRDSLAENVREGIDYETWSKKVLDDVDQGTFMSDAHQETVYRTVVQSALSDGQQTVLNHPLIRSGFPYSRYDAIHDDRVRENHLALEQHGIQGTNIYRNDDPVFQIFRPPWDYNDRCGSTPITVRQAAEAGIEEAVEWLRTGVEPAVKAHVKMPPFQPPEGFRRAVAAAPLSIQLSLHPLVAFGWVTVGGKQEGNKKHKGGTPVNIDGSGVVTKGPKGLKGKDLDKNNSTSPDNRINELRKLANSEGKVHPNNVLKHTTEQERTLALKTLAVNMGAKGIFRRVEIEEDFISGRGTPHIVDISSLKSTQDWLNLDTALAIAKGESSAGHGGKDFLDSNNRDDWPMVIKFMDELYIFEGHTRTVGAYLAGRSKIKVNIINLDGNGSSLSISSEEHPRNNANQFIDKYTIANAARSAEAAATLRESIPEDQRHKLDMAIVHLQTGGTIHHPSEPSGLGIDITGKIPDPRWAKYAAQLDARTAWDTRNIERGNRRRAVEQAIKLIRKDEIDPDEVDKLLEDAGANGAEMRAIARARHRSNGGVLKSLENLYEDIAEAIHSRLDAETEKDTEIEEPEEPDGLNESAFLSVDSKGHRHKGKGKGGGQFTSASTEDGATSTLLDPTDTVLQEVIKHTKQLARVKIKSVPVPTPEQIAKARAELELAKQGKGRAGGDSRGGSSADRRKQRINLFKEFGGEKRGYICCHGCGRKLHHSPPDGSNLERLERGKIFVKCQGGGYQLPNLLPECFQCNRSRNDDQLRKDIKC